MRLLYDMVLKNITKTQYNKCNKVFSYGKFLRDNPKATKNKRIHALKKYLDSTK